MSNPHLNAMQELYLRLQGEHPLHQEFEKTQYTYEGLLLLPEFKQELGKLYTSYGGDLAYFNKAFDPAKEEWQILNSFLLFEVHEHSNIQEALELFDDPQLKTALRSFTPQKFGTYEGANHTLLQGLEKAAARRQTAEDALAKEFPTAEFEETAACVKLMAKHATDPADVELIAQYTASMGKKLKTAAQAGTSAEGKKLVEEVEHNLEHSGKRGWIIGGIVAAVAGLGYGLYAWSKPKTHAQREDERSKTPATQLTPS